MAPNRSQMGSSGNPRDRNQFSRNSGPRGGSGQSGGGGGFGPNRNSSMRQNR